MIDKRKVFISHSSQDLAFAKRLCDIFEKNDLPCWIAPRDIPYGTLWSEKITLAIENSEIMIFVFSENSNRSVQTIREINLAEQNGIPIIAVKLTESKYNRALNYYMSVYQWISVCDDADDGLLYTFSEDVKALLKGECDELAPTIESDKEILCINIDDELSAAFEELSKESHEGCERQEEKISPFRKKLLDRICEKFTDELFVPSCQGGDDGESSEEEEGHSLYFSMNEKEGETLAFIIRRKISERDLKAYFYAEPLEKSVESRGDTNIVTYYVENVSRLGNPLTTISFLKNSSVIMINMGFIDGDTVRLSKSPKVMQFDEISLSSEKEIVRYSINEKSQIVIIDPESVEIVPRKQYYDRATRKTVHYIELYPEKKYFSFEINGENREPMSVPAHIIANAYYYGEDGLNKNVVKAAEWYEKDGSLESILKLCEIFTNDPLLANEEDREYYRKLYLEKKGEE